MVLQVDYMMPPGQLAPHQDRPGAKLYLWSSVLLTLLCTAIVPFTIDWLSTTLPVGIVFCMVTWSHAHEPQLIHR